MAQIPVQAQRNAYDCGMFVLEIAFQLLKRKFDSSSKTAKPEDLLSWAKKDLNVAEMRVYLKTTIAHLAAESTPVRVNVLVAWLFLYCLCTYGVL